MDRALSQLLKLKVIIFLIFINGINSSFIFQSDDNLVIPKVNKDLSWIKPYSAIYSLFNQDQWEKNTTRSFDSAGVHLTKKGYHPVNASHYALFCYDEYRVTKDEKYKKAFLAQVAYLRNAEKYHEFEGERVGYPYMITFHDLKPPWYSSLAQAEAISVLIRYYALTRDESVLPLIVKVKNFMVYPMKKGGCLDHSPEGYEWYEEYPNSKQEAHNFSGYYIALLAMGEYSQLFPSDTASVNLYNRTLIGGKMSNKIYDSGSGIYYNRGDRRLCSPGYLKWMTNLMEHMEEFSGDSFFKFQKMIWSTYSYGKDYIDVGVKKDYYNWSVPILKSPENKFECSSTSERVISTTYVKEVKNDNMLLKTNFIFDANPKTYFTLNKSDSKAVERNLSVLFSKEIETTGIELNMLMDSLDYKSKKFSLYYKSEGDSSWHKIKIIKAEQISNKVHKFSFSKLNFRQVKIDFNDHRNSPIALSEIKIIEKINLSDPEYMFYKTGPIQIKEGNAKLNCKFESGIKHWIFYRTANTEKELAGKHFPAEKAIIDDKFSFDSKDKLVEYLIICEYKKLNNGIRELKFQ